jgi:Domain of unknown function (DUF4252)
MKNICLLVIIVIIGAAAEAQTIKVPESWDQLAAKADEVANINLDRKMLKFAAKFMDMDKGDDDAAEAKSLISKLNGIYVRTLEFKEPRTFSDADVEPIRAQLRGAEWSHIVDVNSKADKERVDIYVKTVNDQTMGMVILAQEPTSLAFIDLDGAISPDDLDKLSGNFGIPKNIHAPHSKAATASAPKSQPTVQK